MSRIFLAVTVTMMFVFAPLVSRGADPVSVVETKPLGTLKYTPPPDETWEAANDCGPKLADYVARSRDARMVMKIAADMEINDEVIKAVVRQLKGENQKNKLKVLMEPTAESDDRFALKVHERVEVGKGDKAKISEQLHLYRFAGTVVVMSTINSVATDPEIVKAQLAAGEQMLLSVTGPGVRPPRVAATKPAKPTTKPAKQP